MAKHEGRKDEKRKEDESLSDASAKLSRSLRLNYKAIDAHTEVMRTATAVTHALNRAGVRKVLAQIWGIVNPTDIKDSEPLTDYVRGSAAAFADFANTLNDHFPGLRLTPGKMTGQKVGKLITLILDNMH